LYNSSGFNSDWRRSLSEATNGESRGGELAEYLKASTRIRDMCSSGRRSVELGLPNWFQAWYLLNLVVLPFDWLFIVLRPRTLESRGGDLAYLFPMFQVYARLDYLFDDTDDDLVYYIYHVFQPLSLLIISFLAFRLRRAASVSVALLCIVEAVCTATKTLLYLLYSWRHIVPVARIPISIMNSSWVLVPMLITYKTVNIVASASDSEPDTDRCHEKVG
jgi:hypothetical protein